MKTLLICFSTARTLGGGTGAFFFLTLVSAIIRKKLFGRKPRKIFIRAQGKSYPFYIRDAVDVAALYEVFVEKQYDAPFATPDTIIDIGGHIGSATLFFASKYPHASIRVFEPDPHNFEVLTRNTASLPQVTCYNLAISDQDGVIDFYSSLRSISSSLYKRTNANKIRVETKTLGSILATPADLIKFDVEGVEYRMFSVSELAHNVSSLVGELHYDLMGCDENTFLSLFKNHTHTIRPISRKRSIAILEH